MDALAKLFPFLGSTELMQTLISIAVAAIVFFYSVFLLRKEELDEQADKESASDIGGEMRRQA
jgi:phosphotransferase system  glucose/maltose/N-acetylglucosamine-specific IIC component